MRTSQLRLKLPLAASALEGSDLPSTLTRAASDTGGPVLPVVPGVRGMPIQETVAQSHLLALEASDGTTVFIRADKLAEDLARVRPELVEADGSIDLGGFRGQETAFRGLGVWVWRQVHTLAVEDNVENLAKGKLQDWLADKPVQQLTTDKLLQCSTVGAKALMEAIEQKLAGEPGLYQWNGDALTSRDRCRLGDGRLSAWGGQAALVFIHGIASNTVTDFGDLRTSLDWEALTLAFGERIFGFEHWTFSHSPIDNALALAEVLPAGANLCLVTHSRGGLVGDLMCLGAYTRDAQALVDAFRRVPRPDEAEAEADDTSGELRALREKMAAEEQAKLRKLYGLLAEKKFVVRRYVRVAAPAAGTALLSDNLEVFLSGLLELVRKLSAWGAGAAAVSGGLGAQAAEAAISNTVSFLSRVVLEIARQRLQPQLVPGIEAMLPESPLGAFLARAGRSSGTAMAVIAGLTEGGGMVRRIGVMFTDWMFFDRANNDLVVDTASMYAGIAREGAHALFDQGPEVNHFHYFRNPRTRGALRGWLVEADPARLPDWTPMPSLLEQQAAVARSAAPPPPDNTRPVVIYLPGIMGSNLEINRNDPLLTGSGDRIWLDFLDLAAGGLTKIAFDQKNVAPDDVVALTYGQLANYLEKNHRVIRFAYDWRQSNLQQGLELAMVVDRVLKDHPDQPVRILAHGSAGLVCRAMIHLRPDLWEAISNRNGRLVMLGTPNHGSYWMVESLLGKSDMVRMLARLDLAKGLQAVLDILADFPGALQLLPQPGFVDASESSAWEWLKAETWATLTAGNDDIWFGKNLGGKPRQEGLQVAVEQWSALDGGTLGGAAPISHPERIAYVFGQADNTPCGIKLEVDGSGRPRGIAMLGTSKGDGSVTWASGHLIWLPEDRYWLMPVDHSNLVNSPEYFAAIEELLATGNSSRLARVPVSADTVDERGRSYNAGPPPGYPCELSLVATVTGGFASPKRHQVGGKTKPELEVSVHAGNCKFLRVPVLCGHYFGDSIAGAEQTIDRYLVGGALTRRNRFGVYAGPLGTTSLVLLPRERGGMSFGTGKGALIVGLGEFGSLNSSDITGAVRAGILRLLLHVADTQSEGLGAISAEHWPLGLRLASVLIGYNSTLMSVDESVAAVTRGVLEANRLFEMGAGADAPGVRVAHLEFVELYHDVALSAARAVAMLPIVLAPQIASLGLNLIPARELFYGEGVRPRRSESVGNNYWPRLIVTDADDFGRASPLGNNSPTWEQRDIADAPDRSGQEEFTPTRYPERLHFIFLSERARAEVVVQQRQPGLVWKLVADEMLNLYYRPNVGIGRTLFHLLVPIDLKSAVSEATNLLLVVDGCTANLPWEMLETDAGPLALSTPVMRQFATVRFRPGVQGIQALSAYIISNPSTQGYYTEFGGKRAPKAPEDDHLPNLPGAEMEGEAIAGLLERDAYSVVSAPGGSRAADVIAMLYRQTYRLLVISGHGIFQATDRQGVGRSGLVLSDGLILTAAEIGQMDPVPELVFINSSAGRASNRLAHAMANELVEIGVRCVLTSGWELDDAAAITFATRFFERFVNLKESFGTAVFQARRACFDAHPDRNTWGAYQAYGDPGFTLGERPTVENNDDGLLLAPVELVDWVDRLRVDARDDLSTGNLQERFERFDALISKRLKNVPPRWLDRADVQQALGGLYAAFGDFGFEKARSAYQSAISSTSSIGVVASITAVEELASLEARAAAKLGGTDGKSLIDRAINRLKGLLACAPSAERYVSLGIAWKYAAGILAHAKGATWPDVEAALGRSRNAFVEGSGSVVEGEVNPYVVISRLQLDGLLADQSVENKEELIELAKRCKELAGDRFTKSSDFSDAILIADAELAIHMLKGSLMGAEHELTRIYVESSGNVSAGGGQFGGVAKQLRLLTDFYLLRNLADDQASAHTLAVVADALDMPAVHLADRRFAPKSGRKSAPGQNKQKKAIKGEGK